MESSTNSSTAASTTSCVWTEITTMISKRANGFLDAVQLVSFRWFRLGCWLSLTVADSVIATAAARKGIATTSYRGALLLAQSRRKGGPNTARGLPIDIECNAKYHSKLQHAKCTPFLLVVLLLPPANTVRRLPRGGLGCAAQMRREMGFY